MRTIQLNSLQLNAVRLNGIGECQRVNRAGAPPIVPDVPDTPDIPDIPEEPDVPTNPDVDENGYIIFADPEVQRICAENWGDGIGITSSQVAAVTSIGNAFRNNTTIRRFEELNKFTNVTTLSIACFENCTALEYINLDNIITIAGGVFQNCTSLSMDLRLAELSSLGNAAFKNTAIGYVLMPSVLKIDKNTFQSCKNLRRAILVGAESIEYAAFDNCPLLDCILLEDVATFGQYTLVNCPTLEAVVINNSTPPSVDATIVNAKTPCFFYVPASAVESYRSATNWNNYASRIRSIEFDLPNDNPELYAEIEEYL